MAQIKVKHQVFISSTYVDLQEERQEAMRAVLKLNCIPAGMELFPAANEDSWSLIRRVIDDCDYYIVIVGGRYGSLMPDGVSFTEKEYDYAVERKGIPVLAFLRKSLPKSTESPEACEKLKKFRARVEQDRNPEFWSTPHELRAAVASSLAIARESIPAIGWVRGDLVPSRDASEEILSLRKENEQLQEQLRLARFAPPQKTLYFVVYDNGGLKASNVNQTLEQVIQNIHDVPPPSGQWQKAEIKGVDGLLGGIFSTAIASAALFPNEHLRKTEIQKLTRLLMDIPTIKVVINKGGKK